MDKKRSKRKNEEYELNAYMNHGNHFILSKTRNCKSPGSNNIPNYWLKAFPSTHSLSTV
jgi:hypothetical protein